MPHRRSAGSVLTHWHRLFWLALLLVLALPATAANDRGLFYRAHRDGIEIYLLGSLHVADDGLYPLRPAIENAFADAQTLAVEVDITRIDPVAVAEWMRRNGQYPAGDSLRNHVSAATWERLERYLRGRDIDPATVENQKPGLLVSMLTMLELTEDGLNSQLGIDQHFLTAAAQRQKPVLALETLEEQMSLLIAMPNPDRSINELLDEIDDVKSFTDELVDAWKKGDTARLQPLIEEAMSGNDAESRAYFSRLLQQRNHSMTDRLLNHARPGARLFVVVGAAHLVGAEGIPALLKQRGFNVEQL